MDKCNTNIPPFPPLQCCGKYIWHTGVQCVNKTTLITGGRGDFWSWIAFVHLFLSEIVVMKNLRRKHEMGWSVKIGYRCAQKQNFKPWKWVLATVRVNLKPSVYENILKQSVYTVIISCCHQFFESVAPPTLTFRFKSRFNSNWAKSISPN